MLKNISIRARLRLFLIALLGLLLGLAGSMILVTAEMENATERVISDHYHVLLLTQIDSHVAKFRIAEMQSGLANMYSTSNVPRSVASLATVGHISAVADLGAKYRALLNDSETPLWDKFQKRWEAYLTEHDAWVANGLPRGYLDQSEYHFKGADEILDVLSRIEDEEVQQSLERAELLGKITVFGLAIGVVLALLFAGWAMWAIRNQISRPLASITKALSTLAAGNRDVEVPEIDRKDEIGEMAKAFEVFRQNAHALEHAHEVAEAAQKRAQALARHDVLTGLPNRRVFSEALENAVDRAKFGAAAYAVFLIDLDRFKPVNDSHGHPAGDMVLIAVADRLRKVAEKVGIVARIGGDEFAVIVESEPGLEQATKKAQRLAVQILAAICVPIALGENHVDVDSSIGIAMCPADGMDAETLLRAADIAMYKAKRAGRGTARFFEQSMDVELRARADLDRAVRRAVAREEIKPFYQPLMDLANGKLLGFEILARWHRPDRGMVMPDVFIPIVEELGLIAEMTFSILRRACLDARCWPENLGLSLNVSSLQLKDYLFPAQLLVILNETGFSPRRLEIEITESALISDLEMVKSVLHSIQSMGVKIALDDFGTGYSSLNHLRELSLDKVKIDRSFIQSMRDDPESVKLVNAILGLTRSLGLPTTAEGLEDAEAVKRVIEAGCEFGQGYFFGKAMSPADALLYVNQHFGLEPARAAGWSTSGQDVGLTPIPTVWD
ncbi:hypothetical protein BH10PSE7_BH10PSE7_12280 [soil metagenome]